MQLVHGRGKDKYKCELTEYLDMLAGFSNGVYYHYILVDNYFVNNRVLPIRVPGGTVGGIWMDTTGLITKIVIDTDYVVRSYPDNVNDLVSKFVGQQIVV